MHFPKDYTLLKKPLWIHVAHHDFSDHANDSFIAVLAYFTLTRFSITEVHGLAFTFVRAICVHTFGVDVTVIRFGNVAFIFILKGKYKHVT